MHNNFYPIQSINIIVNKQRNKNIPATNNDIQQIYISAPYIQRTSEGISRIFKKYNVDTSHKPTPTLIRELCHFKDHKPISERVGVVYRLIAVTVVLSIW